MVDINELFFKIWRNFYLKNLIFKYLLIKKKNRILYYKNTRSLIESFKRGELIGGVNKISFTGKNIFIDGFKIPDTITSINFGNKFNKPIKVENLTKNVKELIFGNNYNIRFGSGSGDYSILPNTIESIKLGSKFKESIKPNSLPLSLTNLDMGSTLNLSELQIGSIPKSVKTITFGTKFRDEINTNLLPKKVSKLIFPYCYSRTIGRIPKSVTDLTIKGNLMNSYIKNRNIIPKSVTILDFEISKFPLNIVHPILLSELIPPNVKSLKLGYCFNESISGSVIPSSCTQLSFGFQFKQPIETSDLPDSITNLSFGFNFNEKFGIGYLKLPPSLTHLELGGNYTQTFDADDCFPQSLTTLKYSPCQNQSLSNATSILNLIIDDCFRGAVLNSDLFPPNITTLNFGEYSLFNIPIQPKILPNKLKSIKFGWDFNQSLIENSIPLSVKSIIFGNKFNKKIQQNTLPPNLLHLTFGHCFVKPFGDVLEKLLYLESITVGRKFQHPINKLKLPPSLISFIYT